MLLKAARVDWPDGWDETIVLIKWDFVSPLTFIYLCQQRCFRACVFSGVHACAIACEYPSEYGHYIMCARNVYGKGWEDDYEKYSLV